MPSVFAESAPAHLFSNWMVEMWPSHDPAVKVIYTRRPKKRTKRYIKAWTAAYRKVNAVPMTSDMEH